MTEEREKLADFWIRLVTLGVSKDERKALMDEYFDIFQGKPDPEDGPRQIRMKESSKHGFPGVRYVPMLVRTRAGNWWLGEVRNGGIFVTDGGQKIVVDNIEYWAHLPEKL